MRLQHWFYIVPLRLRSLFRRAQVEQELDEELRYHLERQIEENIAKGMTPEDARYAALRAIGGVERRKEECRDMRRVRLLEDLIQDLRYGLRTLRKSPGFTAVAALSLALGIGANTAIFSLVDPILLKPLPVKDPEQLVVLNTIDDRGDWRERFSYPMFEQFRARTQVFSGVFAKSYLGGVEMIGPEHGNRTEKVRLQLVTGEYLQVLGVNAVLGRTLTTADEQMPGAHRLAVLSYSFRQRRFAGAVTVTGKGMTLGDHPLTIIGVKAAEFFGDEMGGAPDIWATFLKDKVGGVNDEYLRIMARLRPGAPIEQAQAALDLFLRQIKSEPSDLSNQAWMSKIVLSSGRQGFAGWFAARVSQPLGILRSE